MQKDSKDLILFGLVAACFGSIGSIAYQVTVLSFFDSFGGFVFCGGAGAIFGVVGGTLGKIFAYFLSKSIGIKTWAVCGFISGLAGAYLTWVIVGAMLSRSTGLIPY